MRLPGLIIICFIIPEKQNKTNKSKANTQRKTMSWVLFKDIFLSVYVFVQCVALLLSSSSVIIHYHLRYFCTQF